MRLKALLVLVFVTSAFEAATAEDRLQVRPACP